MLGLYIVFSSYMSYGYNDRHLIVMVIVIERLWFHMVI